MKSLRELLNETNVLNIKGDIDISIKSVCFDSRFAGKDDLFIAVPGTKVNGHDYIHSAIKNGAIAVVCELLPSEQNEMICYVQVKDSHEALGIIAANYFEHPSSKLRLIGVTGTNGKTTVTTLLYKLVRDLGYKAGLISTIAIEIMGKARETTHTTPDPLQINRALGEMVAAGCEYAFMEISSHAIVQKRINGLTFRGGIFTNITHDHLDYHHGFREYLEAKKLFFDYLTKDAFALFNIDDRNGRVIVQNTKANIFSYGIKSMADFRALVIETHLEGSLLRIGNKEINICLPGVFNVYNLLAVYGAALLLGMNEDSVLKSLSIQQSVRGRFEIVKSDRGITGIVDYAHTPDALENVLNTINKIKTGGSRIITIVGAGGNRDKAKRPLMAKIAAGMSDKLILTSDNPRDEEPDEIINDMMKGINNSLMRSVLRIPDREEAIRTACTFAAKGDIILLAGKGHETYQEIKGVKKHFNDKEILIKYI